MGSAEDTRHRRDARGQPAVVLGGGGGGGGKRREVRGRAGGRSRGGVVRGGELSTSAGACGAACPPSCRCGRSPRACATAGTPRSRSTARRRRSAPRRP